MKKILSFIIVTFLIVLSGIYIKAVTGLDKLVVNYYRYSGSEKLHTAWVWQYAPVGGDGVEHQFQQATEPKWLKLEVDLTNDTYRGSTIIGIIIKEGSGWNGPRQPGGDRLIDLSRVHKEGTTGHVYFVQEDAKVYYSLDEADTSDKILDAYFQTNHDITVNATEVPSKVELYENGQLIDTNESISTATFTIKPSKFNISNKYLLKAHFGETVSDYNVSFRKLYDTEEYQNAYHYDGDLGVIYTKEKSTFRLWSPVSEEVNLLLYNQGHSLYDHKGNPKEEKAPYQRIEMKSIGKGTWEAVVEGDLATKYYTFEVNYNRQSFEIVDPYAYSTGANGQRAQVVDFAKTNPKYWKYGDRPNNIKNLTDYIIYELQVRDLTTHESWGGNEDYRGTFLGVAQGGTSYTDENGVKVTTGLDHLAELGINAVHFLPIFDFGYVDETKLKDKEYMDRYGFNWGYMPYNFNTPEGSFSTNPFDGYQRVKELKAMIEALHFRNIRVIMDVVYNHTGETEGSQFEKSMPGYYFRQNADGSFSNGSGTGNETASERSMFRKYMIDSILFWAKEYNISGFRFDLMGLHDIETMNEIRAAVNEVDPTIILYGEPWTGGDTPLDGAKKADKQNVWKLNGVGSFNDNTRDAIKKQWNTGNRDVNNSNAIRYGVSGGVAMDWAFAQVGHQTFHVEPYRTINYVTAHDDETLRDLNYIQGARDDKLISLQKQSNAFVLTSQGIPFLHAGVDFMRSKPVPEELIPFGERITMGLSGNSYNMPDVVNQLNWTDKAKYKDVYEFYRHLIAFRRISDNLRLKSADLVKSSLSFINPDNNQYISYRIKSDGSNPEIVVLHSNDNFASFKADKNYIRLTTTDGKLNAHGFAKVSAGTTINTIQYGTIILVEDVGSFDFNPEAKPYTFYNASAIPKDAGRPAGGSGTTGDNTGGSKVGLILAIVIPSVVVLAGAGVLTFILIKRKNTSA